MRLNLNKFFLAAFTSSFLSTTASAIELFRLNEKVVGFQNFSSPTSILLLSENGNTYTMNDLKLKKGDNYKVHPACNLKSQNTSSMDGSEAGMLLAYPYFIGLGKVCLIDEKTKQINLVFDFKNQIPRNAFSLAYVGSDSKSVYFLLNGRVYPEAESGYIYALSINKLNHNVIVKPFITDVPGFSAAMVFDSKKMWITTWMGNNQIYTIDTSSLLALLQSEKTYKFVNITTYSVEEFEGLSSYALKNETDFLFYNYEYDSYIINTLNKTPLPQILTNTCEPLVGFKKQWVKLCEANTLILQ